jgi:fumarylpyruvate hydrolase
MVDYAFPAPPVPGIPVAGANVEFPVRRIYCVGRNYAAHAREMGFDPDREPPFFFCKPADAVVRDGATIPYALATSALEHEIELVVAIGREGREVAREAALELVYGYAVGIDLTRRDLQLAAREKGRPWDTGKAFDQSAPVGAIRRVSDVGHPAAGAIWLEVNQEPRQRADLNQLIWPVADVIAELSKLFVLAPGDLVFTGTPAGVGPVLPGDRVRGGIAGVGEISLEIGPRA